jgi:hypothetical protein
MVQRVRDMDAIQKKQEEVKPWVLLRKKGWAEALMLC